MKKINIQRLNKIQTIKFKTVDELTKFLHQKCFISYANRVAEKIWNLNIDASLERNNLRFSINSKEELI